MDQEKLFLSGLAVVLTVLSLMMTVPFLNYLVAGAIIAFALHPLQKKLETRMPSTLSAGLLITSFVLMFAIPFGIGANAVADDARDLLQDIDSGETIDFNTTERYIQEYLGQDVEIEQEIENRLSNATSIIFGGIPDAVNLLTSLALGMIIMTFAMFYLLRDGEALVKWVMDNNPVDRGLQENLVNRASIMTWSVLKGHVLVAIGEALIAGLGLYVTGVNNVAFWTAIMAVLAFIPVIGVFMVWAPASVVLFLQGQELEGIFLFIYGVTVVSASDNIMRPYLVDKRANLHPAVILVGVLGGVLMFGAVGLFIGPVLLGFTKTVLEVTIGRSSS